MNSLEERQKILVVDDSKFNQELIMEILGEEYQYVLANDGLEAISILQKDWTIDLMLLDINMPRMNGFKVLEYMNEYHWIRELPVIVISAEEENSIIEKAYNLGSIVLAHGGKIWVENVKPHGACFKFVLDAVEVKLYE